MSGGMAGAALQEHFDSVCRDELERLRRKLVGLSDFERESAESIIADVINALTREPSQVLAHSHTQPTTIEAVVRLFNLQLRLTRN